MWATWRCTAGDTMQYLSANVGFVAQCVCVFFCNICLSKLLKVTWRYMTQKKCSAFVWVRILLRARKWSSDKTVSALRHEQTFLSWGNESEQCFCVNNSWRYFFCDSAFMISWVILGSPILTWITTKLWKFELTAFGSQETWLYSISETTNLAH